ncbi:hypothetical protein J2S40_002653 [Nocardioides luteus]|nr:hypothetical protein [Nocardioides luteus]MDR7311595.1 hypothetical protein [Nocardioides luteus]
MDAGKPPDTWQTPNSSEAARDRHKRLVEDLNDIAAPLSAIVAGLDSAASSIRSAKESAKTAYDGAVGKGWTVKFPGGTQVEIEDPTPPESKAPGHRGRHVPTGHPEQGTMDSYADTISKALADATEAETELESVLNTAAAGGYDGGDGEIADAIPPEIGKILASGMEDRDKPDKAAMERFAAYMKELEDEPELKRTVLDQMGREGIANAFTNAKDAGVDLKPALGAPGRDLIEDWVEEDIKNQGVNGDTNTLLGAYKKDETFTKELFENVTPDEWADAIKHENGEAFSRGKIDEADRKIYSEFLRAGGTALATYTQGHPNPTDLADKWFKSITEGDDENASALTLMIKKGGEDGAEFQTDFMYNLTDDVYNWEKSHDGDPVWGPKDVGLVDPDADVEYSARGRGAYVLQSGSANDGMANLLGGMAHSPEAAQQFFKDGTLDNGKEDDRFKYFMLDRTFSASDKSDEGDGFGLALEAATVGSLEHGDREFANDLADRTFETIAKHSGSDDEGWFGEAWHTWPEFNDSLGAIGAGYRDDIYDVMKGAGGNDLELSKKDLQIVLGEMGRGEDKSGVELLSASLVQEGNHRVDVELERYLKDHPNATMQDVSREIGGSLAAINTETGGVLGDTLGASVLVDLDDEQRAAEKAAFMQKAFSLATGFIPGPGDAAVGMLQEGAGDVTKHLVKTSVDTATSEGLDAMKNAIGSTPPASSWLAGQEDSGAQMLSRNLMNTYLDAGLLPDDLVKDITVETEEGRIFRPDIYTADDINKIEGLSEAERDQLRESWRTWDNSNPSRYLEDLGTNGLQQFDQRIEDAAKDAKELSDMDYDDRQKWREQ